MDWKDHHPKDNQVGKYSRYGNITIPCLRKCAATTARVLEKTLGAVERLNGRILLVVVTSYCELEKPSVSGMYGDVEIGILWVVG